MGWASCSPKENQASRCRCDPANHFVEGLRLACRSLGPSEATRLITPIAVNAVTIVNVAPTPHVSMSSCELWAFRRASKAWSWAVVLASKASMRAFVLASKASMRVMTSRPDLSRSAWVALYALRGPTSGQHIAALSSASLRLALHCCAVLRSAENSRQLATACECLARYVGLGPPAPLASPRARAAVRSLGSSGLPATVCGRGRSAQTARTWTLDVLSDVAAWPCGSVSD